LRLNIKKVITRDIKEEARKPKLKAMANRYVKLSRFLSALGFHDAAIIAIKTSFESEANERDQARVFLKCLFQLVR